MAFWNRKPEKSNEEKAAEIKALRDQRMQIEGQNKLSSQLSMEKQKLRAAKKDNFNSTGTGKFLHALDNVGKGIANTNIGGSQRKPKKKMKEFRLL